MITGTADAPWSAGLSGSAPVSAQLSFCIDSMRLAHATCSSATFRGVCRDPCEAHCQVRAAASAVR